MKKDIIERYVATMDKKQFMEDLNEASKELSAFVSSFCYTDFPVAVYLMQSYAQKILGTNEDMQKAVDTIDGLFGNVLLMIPTEKNGGGKK